MERILLSQAKPVVMKTPIFSVGSSWHGIYENSEFSVDPIMKFSYHHLVLFNTCDERR
jgi:hypothetical protein